MELLRPLWAILVCHNHPLRTGDRAACTAEGAGLARTFITLSKIVGPDCIAWRYDPIFLSDTYTAARHIAEFEQMASVLSGYTRTCVISFIDLYEKVRRNFPQVKSVSLTERETLGKALLKSAKIRHDDTPLRRGHRAGPLWCRLQRLHDATDFRSRAAPSPAVAPQKPARKECACCLTADIGAYNTCGHGCLYCYANASRVTVAQNMRMHDPASPFFGRTQPAGRCGSTRQNRKAGWSIEISMAELL